MISQALSLIALLGTAVSVPLTTELTLEPGIAGRADNCTNYCQPSGFCVCTVQPYDCTAYADPVSGDSCLEFANRYDNFSLSIFHYWHPDLSKGCNNLVANVPYCINTPWYAFEGAVEKPYGTVESIASLPATQQPYPLNPSSVDNCTKYELVGPGIGVYDMVQDNGITFDEFYSWNPNVNPQSNIVLADYWYCVGV